MKMRNAFIISIGLFLAAVVVYAAPMAVDTLNFNGNTTAAVSAATKGNLRYNNAANTFQQSLNGAAWETLNNGIYLPLAGGTMTGAITFSGTQAGTYSLGGTPTLASNLSVASGIDITAAGGASDINYSASSGAFTTPTGTTTLSGAVSVASGVDITAVGGVSDINYSASSGAFTTSSGTNTLTGNVTLGTGTVSTAAQQITLTSGIADSGTNYGVRTNTTNAMTTTRGYLSIANGGTEQWKVHPFSGNGPTIQAMTGTDAYLLGPGGLLLSGSSALANYLYINPSQLTIGLAGAGVIWNLNISGLIPGAGATTGTLDIGTPGKVFSTVYTRHLASEQAAVPTCVAGTGAGTSGSPTCTTLTRSTDLSGTLSVVTATTPAGAGATVATVTFNLAYNFTPVCVLTPADSDSAGLTPGTVDIFVDPTAGSTTTFVVKSSGATGLTGSTTYLWAYTCTTSGS